METPAPLFEHFKELKIFTNLSRLQINSSIGFDQTLASLPSLKEIRLENCIFTSQSFDGLKDLLKQSRVQRRLGLQIYLFGIRLDRCVLDQFKNRADKRALQLKNYEKLAENLAVYDINYNKLMESVGTRLPMNQLLGDLSRKFWKVQEINLTAKIEEDTVLVEFIQNCKCLSELSSKNSGLSQTFWNQLPSICSLNNLTVEEDGDTGLSFDFIGRMIFLKKFTTNQKLSLSTIAGLRELFYLEQIQFKIGKEEQYFINQRRKGVYNFYKKFYKFIKTDVHLDELLKWVEFENKKARIANESSLFGI